MSDGKLYIVSTPIGNMEDITLRAVDVLRSVDMILSEDTRETDKILRKFDIKKSQVSYRDQIHTSVLSNIKNMLKNGAKLALVSDSGTPLISDPGFKLVRDLIEEDIEVITIPGPSALISSLTVSGLPTDKFLFLGFIPKSEGQKEKFFSEYKNIDATIVFYESPFRIIRSLRSAYKVLGNRKVCVCNDLTKIFERITRGSFDDVIKVLSNGRIKGEFVVLIAKEGY